MRARDLRSSSSRELLCCMRTLKMYGWEAAFGGKIEQQREAELQQLLQYWQLQVWGRCQWLGAPVLVAVASFGALLLLRGPPDPPTAFTALALFNLLKFPLQVLPQTANNTIEAAVALERIQGFLLLPEADGLAALRRPQQPQSRSCRLLLIPKSCILFQVPWIQNATLRENILFGLPYDHDWYWEVVEACALRGDLESLPGGDLAEIGEKGINLSGGQKQRVALARGVYRHCRVYLLDDCLSAVDPFVAHHIFSFCFLKLLKRKTVLFATHRLALLPRCSKLLFLRGGRQRFFGRPDVNPFLGVLRVGTEAGTPQRGGNAEERLEGFGRLQGRVGIAGLQHLC
ncbi:ABC transporter protein, putative [Eimeria tenella]|uniref:ABC transporter protein, putative n=1 Tax=Eimeria tenella TaxID=5802 RepID=U6KNZ8_EIMTE|nr:ABC transporter protein, putative [Eimeria tenella]CDJ39701.1 ABC transporter protein, putative [Eimeria tenella]|eukprot:XP_013230454.1 ABC transporter protein, putative [Eimeria tenella]